MGAVSASGRMGGKRRAPKLGRGASVMVAGARGQLSWVKARVMGPREVAGTVSSENPWELGGGKGTNREISVRGFEDTTLFSKTPKASSSVAARWCV